jgi:hypothetical protein
MGGHGLNTYRCWQWPVVDSYKDRNKPLGATKCEEFLA